MFMKNPTIVNTYSKNIKGSDTQPQVIYNSHCWKILLIFVLGKVASKIQYSPVCNCKVVSIGFYPPFYKFYKVFFFNNVNTVRSEMWLLSFPHHSCWKRSSKSLVFDSWLERPFLAFVMWKTQYSHVLLTVFSQCLEYLVFTTL